MRNLVFILPLCLLFLTNVYGQNLPYPQNRPYEFGYMPAGVSSNDAQSTYQYWKSEFLIKCDDDSYRVLFNGNDEIVSEGIGYGMVLAAVFGDREILDGLWKFYNRRLNDNGFMHWKIQGCDANVTGWNSATDAELDVAMALLIADCQWGDLTATYRDDAEEIINLVKEHEVQTGCGTPNAVLKPGDAWGGCSCTNPSYFAPGYYRAYAQFTGDSFWNDLADDTYVTLKANAHETTGLVSDWCSGSGNSGCSEWQSGDYGYDAARTPWRIAVDYLWWGNQDAKEWLTTVTNWVRETGIENIGDGYEQDGTKISSTHNSTFVGAFALGAMCVSQADADDFHEEFVNLGGTSDAAYFQTTLRALYLLVSSGNFFYPCELDCERPKFGKTQALCGNSSIELNTGMSSAGNSFTWFLGSAQLVGEDKNRINAFSPGTYKVKVSSDDNCLVEASVKVTSNLTANLGGDFELCNPSVRTLDASNEATGGISYTWSTGSTASSIDVTKAGTYSVTLSADGCEDATETVVATSKLWNVSEHTTCETVDVLFEVYTAGTFNWYYSLESSVPFYTGDTLTVTLDQTKRYWIEKHGSTVCERTPITGYNTCAVGFDELTPKTLISAYPNPADESFQLSVLNHVETQISIYNSLGVLIDQYKSGSKIEFGSNWNSGMYVIQAVQGDAVHREVVWKR